jgi:ABC-type transport system involved in multi-copper enzyme maturation permease subunit
MKPEFSNPKPVFIPGTGGSVLWQSMVVLGFAELKRNLFSFILPSFFYLITLIYTILRGTDRLDLLATWAILILAALVAMVYGLQCFSNEADKKTLDFILSRPLSPTLIITVKYFLSLSILFIWMALFSATVTLDLDRLPLVEGMGPEWIVLIVLMIHAISFFAGLLAKGLERFFMVTVLTGLLALAGYYLWSLAFNLLKINNLVFDILPYQLRFVQTTIPIYLTVLSLAIPFYGTVWYLRSRIPLSRFQPAKWIGGFWIGTYLLLLLAGRVLAPPLQPDTRIKFGDWHDQTGIISCGPLPQPPQIFKNRPVQLVKCRLALAKLGHKSRVIYTGFNLQNPRFAPDGSRVIFAENGILKILSLRNRRIVPIGSGNYGSWSRDGKQLLCAQVVGEKALYKLYQYDLTTHRKTELATPSLNITGIFWDSDSARLFFWGFKDEVSCLNLKNNTVRQFTAGTDREKPLNYYGIIPPVVSFNLEKKAPVWSQVFEDEVRIFELNPQTGKITLVENVVNRSVKTASPAIINNRFKAFLWQRIDGSFVYQATQFESHKGDNHEHHNHGHGHEDE